LVAFATGRLGSAVAKYVPDTLDDVALLTLNGAAVYMGKRHGSRRIAYTPLPSTYADFLIDHAADKTFVLNYYANDKLYAARTDANAPWIDTYYQQTHTDYKFVESLGIFRGESPSKIIFVGPVDVIDEQERLFRNMWGSLVYICRTWRHYLEFLDVRVNKAAGLEALAAAYGIDPAEIVAFGDEENDIPMLQRAGLGIAMANASSDVKKAAHRVSQWTNDEDGIAKEWELIKKTCGIC
jgi:hypothetical protein